MKSHVQNPWTRSPQLFVHLTVEEVQQLRSAIYRLNYLVSVAGTYAKPDHNQQTVINDLFDVLDHAIETVRPRGLKGVIP